MESSARLRDFIQSFTHLVEQVGNDEERIFVAGKNLLSELISHDDWLPEEFAKPSVERYQQYLLYCDPLERFSVVSFVWAPGQTTPVHDHTVWGMVGVMRGAELCDEYERCEKYERCEELESATARLRAIGSHQLPTGSVDLVSPRIGDIHKVSNVLKDSVSISIHVYGANIGAVKRHVYDLHSGQKKPFISGYSNKVMPSIWDREAD